MEPNANRHPVIRASRANLADATVQLPDLSVKVAGSSIDYFFEPSLAGRMQIMISKNGHQHGPFGLEELRQLVMQGTFTVNDSACFDGHNWGIISEVPGFSAGAYHAGPSPQGHYPSDMGQPYPPGAQPEPSAGMRMLLPVGRSGYAIAAGYLGLLSPFLIFAPFAILFGVLGVKDVNENKDKHGMGRAVFGIIMGVLFSLFLLFWLFFGPPDWFR